MPSFSIGWREVFLVVASAWACVLILLGLILMFDYMHRAPEFQAVWIPLGLVLVAFGQFVGAVVSDRLVSGASRRLSSLIQVSAWSTVAVVASLVLLMVGGAV